MNSAALQEGVYDLLVADAALTAALSVAWGLTPVFSDTPQENADDNSFYPFVSFGPDTTTAFTDKDTRGGNALLQVNAWSRSGDYIEVKQIAERIITVLHRQDVTIAGHTHITTEFLSSDFSIDPDGETRRAFIQFRVIYL